VDSRRAGPIYNKSLSREIIRIDREDAHRGRWVVYNYTQLPNVLCALGVNVVNGTQWIPQFKMWEMLDPLRIATNEVNRLAMVIYLPTDDKIPGIGMKDTQYVGVWFDPCGTYLNKLGVYHILSPARLAAYPCLVKEYGPDTHGLHIYRPGTDSAIVFPAADSTAKP
jgi:hypothetical protein